MLPASSSAQRIAVVCAPWITAAIAVFLIFRHYHRTLMHIPDRMTFLNPLALLGLAAAAIPLLLHLLQRRRLRTIEFSTVRFIRELQRTRIRRLKLRQLLLLFLRTALVLLVVLAFSRPAVRGDRAWVPAHEGQTTAAILIDNSASMERADAAGTLLRQSKSRALAVLELLQDGDNIFVASFSDCADPRADSLMTPVRSRAAAGRLIEDVSGSAVTVELERVADRAVQLARSSTHLQTEVHLFSDFQAGIVPSALRSSFPAPQLRPDRVTFFLHPLGAEAAENVSLDTAFIRSSIFQPGRPVELVSVLQNRSDRAVSDRLISVFLDGRRVAQRAVDLPAEGRVTVSFSVTPATSGLAAGFIELEDDALLEDNRWFFSFRVPARTTVLLIGTPEETSYLRLALETNLGGSSPLSVSSVRAESVLPSQLHNADAVILAHAAALPPELLNTLRDVQTSGRGIILFPGPGTAVSFWNTRLAPALDLPPADSILPWASSGDLRQVEGFRIEETQWRHPLFQGMLEEADASAIPSVPRRAAPTAGVESPQIMRVLRLKLRPTDLGLMDLSAGAPFLVEAGAGQALVFTTSATMAWSDFPHTGLFVPLLRQAVWHATRRQMLQPMIVTGNDVVLPVPERGAGPLTVAGPEGREVVIPRPTDRTVPLVFRPEPRPGTFLVKSGTTIVGGFSANIDRRESQLRRAESAVLVAALRDRGIPQESIRIIEQEEEVASVLSRLRYGGELWKFLLAAALVVALIELLVARDPKGAEEPTAPLHT